MPINPLKEFFKRKKAEVKFARAGPGQTLSSTSSGPTTSAKEAAAEAAMKRFSKQPNDKPTQRARLSQAETETNIQASQSKVSSSQKQVDTSHVITELPVVDGEKQRNVQVYSTEELAQRIKQPELDDDFFRLTVEDAKLFKQRYEEERSRNEILRTSEMRKRDLEAKKPTTNIARLRLKLPNDKIIEASFAGNEYLMNVKEWLDTHVKALAGLQLKGYDILFGFRPLKEADYSKTIRELNLLPATTLTIVNKV